MILSPSRAVRVFAYPAPADLRKGYDGLYGLVETGLRHDPMSGDLFLFVNESRNQKLAPVQAFVFSRRHDGSNYSC